MRNFILEGEKNMMKRRKPDSLRFFTVYVIFILSSVSVICSADSRDNQSLPIIETDVGFRTTSRDMSEMDEGMPRNISRFPEDHEIYIPLPLPISQNQSSLFLDHSNAGNKAISYDLIAKEETEHNALSTPMPDQVCSLIKGYEFGIDPNHIWNQDENDFIENDEIEPKTFSSLSKVANIKDFPWRANVKLYMTFNSGRKASCSGVMIDSMHVLTAGHCVHEILRGGTWASSIVVVPAYDTGDRPYGDASAVELHSWTGWTQRSEFDHDVGVIDLDRPVGALTGWFGYGYHNNPDFYTGNVFNSAGYPGEYPYDGKSMYYWSGNFDSTESISGLWYGNEVHFNNRSYGGQSGSGMYSFDGKSSRIVYAVLSNGVDQPGGPTGCPRLTSDKFMDVRDNIIGDDIPSSVDLIPLNVAAFPSSIAAGSSLSLMTYQVHNYSSATWTGTVDVDVYLSTDNNISTCDTIIQSHSFTSSIGPKSSVILNVSTKPIIPESTPSGEYFLGVILNQPDWDDTNNESDGQDSFQLSVFDNTPPPAPIISSSTHPDENTWYYSSNPSFTWTTPPDTSGIAGYSYLIDNSSNTTPDTIMDTSGNAASGSNLAAGEWYLHVRALDNADNWGVADHFRVRIKANSSPVLDPVGDQSVIEGNLLQFTITASDPDGDNLSLNAGNIPNDAVFTDMGDGTAGFRWQTGTGDEGTYKNIVFTVTDDGAKPLSDSININITVESTSSSGDEGGGSGCFINTTDSDIMGKPQVHGKFHLHSNGLLDNLWDVYSAILVWGSVG